MRFRHFEFGALDIDGVTYEHDVIVDRGEIHRRNKKASKKFRETLATRRCRWKKTFHGSARAWSSAPERMAVCRLWTR
jgi:hypothetical protein